METHKSRSSRIADISGLRRSSKAERSLSAGATTALLPRCCYSRKSPASKGSKKGVVNLGVHRNVMVVAIWLLALGPMLLAQAQRAIILGSVSDATGGAMAGVEVKVIQIGTNIVRPSITNEAGHYEVP